MSKTTTYRKLFERIWNSRTIIIWRDVARSASGMIGLCIVIIYLLITLAAPLIVPYDPDEFGDWKTLQPPSQSHPFGTDNLGRDVFTRTLLGGRIAIPVTIAATMLAMIWGGTVGVFLALTGGKIDAVVMRMVEVLQSIPRLLLLLMIVSAVGNGMWILLLTLGFFYGVPAIRVMRGAALSFVAFDFITAARARGERRSAIIVHELLPNILDVFLIEAAIRWSAMLIAFSSLSFLGFGVVPPKPDWGLMIAMSRGVLVVAPWVMLFPVAAISIFVIGINLLANSLAKVVGVGRIQRIPV
jgi:peptide/nickel transport system permease protein